MKANRLANLVRIVLLCMAMALMISLIAIPWLAKGIAYTDGYPLGPEKLAIRPIPAPRPPLPLANNEPLTTATPAAALASAPLPMAIPVPTPPTQVALPDSALAQNSTSGAAPRLPIPVVTSQGATAIAMMSVLLLILIWWRRASSFRSMHQECAS